MSDDNPRQQISIVVQGFQFTLQVPYAAGHILSDIEAGILNREWTEGVRNGFAEEVRQALAKSKEEDRALTTLEVSNLQKILEGYAASFGFKALSQRFNSHPIVREAHRIAKSILDAKLNSQGTTREQLGDAKYELALSRLMNHPEVVEQARKQLESAKDVASQIIGLEY